MKRIRRIKRRKRGKRINKMAVAALIAIACVICSILFVWHFRISPNLDTIAEMKAKQIVTRAVNEAVREKLYMESAAENLLITEMSSDGYVEMVRSDTGAINLLISDLSAELQKKYKEGVSGDKITVPLGSILGSRILSQYGPTVDLTIMPAAVSRMDFKTEFETQGINQTKYKVYAIIHTEARVLAPFTSGTIEIENTILIAEAIILGRVPQSYVNVPKDEILDAVN